MAKIDCFKCGGSGQTQFTHIENGVCFTCGGSGKLSYRPRQQAAADPHPELLITEAEMSTAKQWDYLVKLTGDSEDRCRKVLYAAGAKIASQRYVSKKVMSAAIEMARS